jgi:uncharacterized protein
MSLGSSKDKPAPPVDEDRDGSLLKAAVEQHKTNRSAAEIFAALPYRDSVDSVSGALPFRDWTPITYLNEIRETKVPIYHLAGWYDRYVRDQLVLYRSLNGPTGQNPQRISIGPWTHTQREHFDFAAEHLRWWDYWLKRIDNGVMHEDPIQGSEGRIQGGLFSRDRARSALVGGAPVPGAVGQ